MDDRDDDAQLRHAHALPRRKTGLVSRHVQITPGLHTRGFWGWKQMGFRLFLYFVKDAAL